MVVAETIGRHPAFIDAVVADATGATAIPLVTAGLRGDNNERVHTAPPQRR